MNEQSFSTSDTTLNTRGAMHHPVGSTGNNISVYVDLIRSDAGRRIAKQPQLLGFAQEALRHVSARGLSISQEYDMGRPVGYSFVVKTTESDTVLYAQLLRETTYTRFVKNGKPLATRFVSIELHRNENGHYELLDIWIGRAHPPRPGSPHDTLESKRYWANHAYILDASTQLQLRTLTKDCPY